MLPEALDCAGEALALTFALLNQRPAIPTILLCVGGKDYRGGNSVAGLQVQQSHALGIAAGFADGG